MTRVMPWPPTPVPRSRIRRLIKDYAPDEIISELLAAFPADPEEESVEVVKANPSSAAQTGDPDWSQYEWRSVNWPEDKGRPAVFSEFDDSHYVGFLVDVVFGEFPRREFKDELGTLWTSCTVLARKEKP